MADNITLKTYKGGNVTPQDDAIIYETAIPGSGIFKGAKSLMPGATSFISRRDLA